MRPFYILLGIVPVLAAAIGSYETAMENWRKEREQKLRAADGWLTVAGLFWLKEGENRAGSDPSYEIVLPEGRAPKRIGVFDFHEGKTSFRVASGAHVTLNGKPIVTADVAPDTAGRPDLLQTGDFTMFVIKRGPKYAIRLRDLHSSMRKEFHGLDWYPIRPEFRIIADFTPKPTSVPIPNILGQTEPQHSPGFATFHFKGRSYRLDPVVEEGQLFFIFRDTTASKTTYGAGRFLYADMPKEGKIVLDFNKAYNPPCAFTPFATCPLPPKQNQLPIAIEAGEKKYGEH